MRVACRLALAALVLFAPAVRAQASAGPSPITDALRFYLNYFSTPRLIAAADDFPVSKYTYKPTAPQQSVAFVVEHLASSNNFLCASVAGVAVPTEPRVVPDSTPPDELKARLKRSFVFCETAFAKLTDTGLSDSVPFFGGKRTRANVILALPYDWGDHYSQLANYLRLNGISPPNARARAVPVP